MDPVRFLRIVWHELRQKEALPRIPEPDLVTTDPEAVKGFTEGGDCSGALAPLHQFHLENLASILRDGHRVIDLGCGSGELLTSAAELFPKTEFVGVDLSGPMLEVAREKARARGLRNVTFRQEDMTLLSSFSPREFDVATSMMAIHHIPDLDGFQRLVLSVDRVLNEKRSLYFSDFARLNTERALELFVTENAETQSPSLIADYRHSLRAAFSVEEWKTTLAPLSASTPLEMKSTPFANFLVTVKSSQHRPDDAVTALLRKRARNLPPPLYLDYRMLRLFL